MQTNNKFLALGLGCLLTGYAPLLAKDTKTWNIIFKNKAGAVLAIDWEAGTTLIVDPGYGDKKTYTLDAADKSASLNGGVDTATKVSCESKGNPTFWLRSGTKNSAKMVTIKVEGKLRKNSAGADEVDWWFPRDRTDWRYQFSSTHVNEGQAITISAKP